MANKGKIRVERFNDVNFSSGSEDADRRLPVPKRSLSLGGKTHKPKEISNGELEILDRKALGVI